MSGIARRLMGVTKGAPLGDFYYPLTNTATDPTQNIWRNSEGARVGYVFVPNDGIYTNEPITNMDGMFFGLILEDADIGLWDVSTVTSMFATFAFSFFNEDISSWDTSNVTNMRQMFEECIFFNQDISSWDVSNVTNMTYMWESFQFFGTEMSMTFPLGSWQTNLSFQPQNFSMGANATFASFRGTADFPLLADGVTRINT